MSTREIAYDIGDLAEIVVHFTNISSGLPANPTAITFTQRNPAGAKIVLNESNATNPAVGEWHWLLPQPFNMAGVWRFRAAGTNGVIAAAEITARVNPSLFG